MCAAKFSSNWSSDWEGIAMSDKWKEEKWAQDFWYSGKVTRRRLIGYGAATAGALGASMLVPTPWRAAFGQAKPFKIGSLQPLSGVAAIGGKTALVGVQMAADRINSSGGINGRPVELVCRCLKMPRSST
jgi:ABC-type branched-subunit amino acid transport system substrate-binding protein